MIANLKEHLTGIVIGVRYRANFSLEDQFGKIVDQVLYGDNSFFNPKVFPVVHNDVNQKTLFNRDTDDSLIINNSNIILQIGFGDRFEVDDMDSIVEHFHSDVIDGIMKKYKIIEINRVGFVHKYLFKIEDLAKSFIDKTIGATLEGINDINLRFSKKIPAQDSMVKEDINDHYDVIFTIIKKSELKELYMSIDYQKYFDPFLSSSSDIEFKKFVEAAISFNSKHYLNWLNKNYGALQ